MGGEQAFWNSARINGQPGGNNPKALKLRALRRLFGTVGRKANCRADIFPSAASTAYFRLSFEASDLRAKGPVFVCGAPRNREGEISLSQRLSLSPPGREKYLRISFRRVEISTYLRCLFRHRGGRNIFATGSPPAGWIYVSTSGILRRFVLIIRETAACGNPAEEERA